MTYCDISHQNEDVGKDRNSTQPIMPENPLRNNPQHRRWLEKSLCFLRSILRFQFMPPPTTTCYALLLLPDFTFIHFDFTDVAVIPMYGRKSLQSGFVAINLYALGGVVLQ